MKTSLQFSVIIRPSNLNITQERARSELWIIIKYRTINIKYACLHSRFLGRCDVSIGKQSNGLISHKTWIFIDKAVRTTDIADLYRSTLVILNISLMSVSSVDVIINGEHMLDHRPWMAVIRFYVDYSESKYRLRRSLAHPRDCHFAHVQWLPLSIEKKQTPFREIRVMFMFVPVR